MSTMIERARVLLVRAQDHLRIRERMPAIHPARAHIHEQRTLGERVADDMAAAVGSWPFVIGQSCFILAWIILNTVAAISHWDPYPWILLNLCMSTQAMYTGPILLLASNRQSAKDRMRDDTEAHEVEDLTVMNQQQLEILRLLRKLVDDEGKGDEAA